MSNRRISGKTIALNQLSPADRARAVNVISALCIERWQERAAQRVKEVFDIVGQLGPEDVLSISLRINLSAAFVRQIIEEGD